MRVFTEHKEEKVVAIISVCFLALALIGLGNRDVPVTTYTPSRGEALYIDLGSVQYVDSILILVKNGESTIKIQSGTTDNWGPAVIQTVEGYYHWEIIPLNKEMSNLRLEVETSGAELAEISLTGASGDKLTISAIHGLDNTTPGLMRLIDEQDKVNLPITASSETNFDEVYFVRAAEDYINGRSPYENTHPPLGKEIIAIGIMVTGYSPFGWRILDAIFAAMMIPALYVLGRELTGSWMCGAVAALLLSLDFMHFTYARLATVDTYVVFFSILSWIFFLRYLKKRNNGLAREYLELILWALSSSLAFSTKWYALFGLLGQLLIIYASGSRWFPKTGEIRLEKQSRSTLKVMTLFTLICGAVYLATYLPQVATGFSLSDIIAQQFQMLSYHTTLTATHPYSSPWYSWPLILKPLWLYISELPANTASTIVAMGNPAIWWLGIVAIVFCFYRFYRHRDLTSLLILVIFSSQWLPYALMSRPLFIYHYYINVPILCIVITVFLREIWEKRKLKPIVLTYLLVAAYLFIIFYPVISGNPVSRDVINSLRWFNSWVF